MRAALITERDREGSQSARERASDRERERECARAREREREIILVYMCMHACLLLSLPSFLHKNTTADGTCTHARMSFAVVLSLSSFFFKYQAL